MLFAARRVPSLVIPPLSYRVATSKAKLSPVLSLFLFLRTPYFNATFALRIAGTVDCTQKCRFAWCFESRR